MCLYQILDAGEYKDKRKNTMYTLWKSLEIKGFRGAEGDALVALKLAGVSEL